MRVRYSSVAMLVKVGRWEERVRDQADVDEGGGQEDVDMSGAVREA